MLLRHWIALAVILIVGGIFRFVRIGQPSLWMDEIWSIEMSMGRGSVHDHLPVDVIRTDQPDFTSEAQAAPWWNILFHMGGVTHPPLYFVVLRWWIDLAGTRGLAVRLLSAIFSLGEILLPFDICRLTRGPRIGLLAAAVCAVAVGQIEFGQEARAYPMLMFFGLAAADAMVRIERIGPSRGRMAGLAVFATATALTHYLSAGFLLVLPVYAVIRLRGKARVKAMTALVVAGGISLAVWTPLFVLQKQTLPSLTPTFLAEQNVEQHVAYTLFRVVGLPAQFLFGEARSREMTPWLVMVIFAMTIVLPAARLVWRRDLMLWVLWGVGTIGFVAGMDLLRQTTLLAYLRYTILASPAIYAAIAAFDWPGRAALRDGLAMAAILLMAICATQRAVDGVPPKEDWRRLARDVQGFAEPGDLLAFHNSDPWISSGTWYMALKYYQPESNHPWVILSDHPSEELLGELRGRRCLWLIGRYPDLEGAGLLPGWRAQMLVETSAGRACRMVPR
jgi:uncharacterized membrane protein